MLTIQQIIDSLASRQTADRWGIGTAAQYLKEIQGCFAGGLCPQKAFDLATPDMWAKELDAAAARLTYCEAGMSIDEKSLGDGAEIGSGFVLEYDCVLISRRKDRDGDILEPNGASLDVKMPLLWQHLQLQPIGSYRKTISVDNDYVRCRFGIADTALGRDAATLVKAGALRKSHGFRPLDFEPIEIVKGADGRDMVRGWHVKKAAVLEGSLVSIPANTDAVITAFAAKSLKTDVVNRWAQKFYDARPIIVPGHNPAATPAATESPKTEKSAVAAIAPAATKSDKKPGYTCPKCKIGFDLAEVPDGVDLSKIQCPACSTTISGEEPKSIDPAMLNLKSLADQTKGNLIPSNAGSGSEWEIEGSFEWIRSLLSRQCRGFLAAKAENPNDVYPYVVATLPDSVIVSLSYGEKAKCYRVDWAMDDGKPKLKGDAKEVVVKPAVLEKMLAGSIARPAISTEKTLASAAAEFHSLALNGGDAGLAALKSAARLASMWEQQQIDDAIAAAFSPVVAG